VLTANRQERHAGAREDPLRRQAHETRVGLLVAPSILLAAMRADIARGDPRRPDPQVVGARGDLHRAADSHEGVRERLVVDGHGGPRIAHQIARLQRRPRAHVHDLVTVQQEPRAPHRAPVGPRRGQLGRPNRARGAKWGPRDLAVGTQGCALLHAGPGTDSTAITRTHASRASGRLRL
jgi:hypothetical protein